MSGEADIETRRKRLLYRSVYRGNKENDILLGQFARACIASFDSAELALDSEAEINPGMEPLQASTRAIARAIQDPAERRRVAVHRASPDHRGIRRRSGRRQRQARARCRSAED